MLDSLVRVSQLQRWNNHKADSFFGERGTGNQDVKTQSEESFSTRRDGHNAELAGVTTNSDGKRRTIGYRRRYAVLLEQTVAVGSYTTLRQRIAQTATMDVIDPSRRLRLPQLFREPFQFKLIN